MIPGSVPGSRRVRQRLDARDAIFADPTIVAVEVLIAVEENRLVWSDVNIAQAAESPVFHGVTLGSLASLALG
jgi:hypothetical protein